MRQWLILFLMLLGTGLAFSGPSADTTAIYKVYRINDKQTKHFLSKKLVRNDTSFFKNVQGSHTFQSLQHLDWGNYLLVKEEAGDVYATYYAHSPFEIQLRNNNLDLIISLQNKSNNQFIKDAAVKIDGNALQWDKDISAFRIRNTNWKGLVTIKYKGNTYHFIVDKNNPWVSKRSLKSNWEERKLGKYLTTPFCIFQKVPKTFKDCTINDECSFWSEISRFEEVRQWEQLYNKYYGDNDRIFETNAYTNKPKYKPGDTVKVKFVAQYKRNSKYYKKPVDVYFNNGSKELFLQTVYNKKNEVGYDFDFVLHDSLAFKIDNWGNEIYFYPHKTKDEIAAHYLNIEEYTLNNYKLNVSFAGTSHEKGKDYIVRFSAKDYNDFPLSDAKGTIAIEPDRVITFTTNKDQFFPFVLWTQSVDIKNGEGKITIPDSLFQNTELRYNIKATLSTTDMEKIVVDKNVNFTFPSHLLKVSLQKDSIHISGDEPYKGLAFEMIQFNNQNKIIGKKFIQIPHKEKREQQVAYIKILTFDSVVTFDLRKQSAQLIPILEFDQNQLSASVHNPLKLPFSYQLYQNKKQIAAGYDTALTFLQEVNTNESYFLNLQYLWADSIQSIVKYLYKPKSNVRLDLDYSPVIYPGKETTFTFTAFDYNDKPLKDFNILSYAINAKFEEGGPALHLPPSSNTRSMYSYYFHRYESNSRRMPMNYQFWNKELSLDEMRDYPFRFPTQAPYYIDTILVQKGKTQAAPFVFLDGVLQPVYYVKVNGEFKYLGTVDHKVPYSFEIDEEKLSTSFEIRTANHLIYLEADKLYKNYKNIISIDVNNPSKNVRVMSAKDGLSMYEKKAINRATLRTPSNNSNLGFSLIQNTDNTIFLVEGIKSSNSYTLDFDKYAAHNRYGSKTAGPITQVKNRFLDPGNFLINFDFERAENTAYEFSPEKIKIIEKADIPTIPFPQVPPLDEYLYPDDAIAQFIKMKVKRIPASLYEQKQTAGDASLFINFKNKQILEEETLFTLLIQQDNPDISYYYSGFADQFLNVLCDGIYQIAYVNANNSVVVYKDIQIQKGGMNLKRLSADLSDTIPFKYDFDLELLKLYYSKNSMEYKISQLKNIVIASLPTFKFKKYKGFIATDDGHPIVNTKITPIKQKGLSVVTNEKGYFELPLASDRESLDVLLQIGDSVFEVSMFANEINHLAAYLDDNHKQIKIIVGKRNEVINEDDLDLDNEIVVFGYKPLVKEKYAGAADVLSSGGIERMPVADITEFLEGAIPGIQITAGNGSPGSGMSINIRGNGSISGSYSPLIVIDGAIYAGDVSNIDPLMIENVSVLKDATATSLYGSRGANGVIVIHTKSEIELPKEIKDKMEFPNLSFNPEELMQSGMRTNFKDDAFWHPELITDKDGKVSFSAIFPEDITSWDMFAIGRNHKGQLAYKKVNIKSFKPLSAQLLLPAFFVESDSINLVGRVQNITTDTVPITLSFKVNDESKFENELSIASAHINNLPLKIEKGDTVRLTYSLKKEDGYLDGEERNVKIFPRGARKAEGSFMVLSSLDTSFLLPANANDSLYIRAHTSLLEVVIEESNILKDYEHLCNEQIASKIFGLLQLEKLKDITNKPFSVKDKKDVQKLIDKLLKNKKQNLDWTWWEANGNVVPWMSTRIVQSLFEAHKNGYRVSILKDSLKFINNIVEQISYDDKFVSIDKLKMLHLLNAKVDYKKYVNIILSRPRVSFTDKVSILKIQKERGLEINPAFIKAQMQTDILGNIFWKDSVQNIHNNELMATVNVLEYLEIDSSLIIDKYKVINWILQQRKLNGYNNTYESARVLEVLSRNLVLKNIADYKAKLTFSGGVEEGAQEFPFSIVIPPNANPVSVLKSGNAPVYFTHFTRLQDTGEAPVHKDFIVNSYFEKAGKKVFQLQKGEDLTLQVNVEAKQEANFVMISIPIPAGCSYVDKKQYFGLESYREYYYNRVCIFLEKLPAGKHAFSVDLRPRFSGDFTLNPSQAELMYFPTFYGREGIKRVIVLEDF